MVSPVGKYLNVSPSSAALIDKPVSFSTKSSISCDKPLNVLSLDNPIFILISCDGSPK